jgi:hypothetical protein
LEHDLGAVIASEGCPTEPTTILDLTPMDGGEDPEVIRLGRGALEPLGLGQ